MNSIKDLPCRGILNSNMKSLALLGRQPALGLAELESLFGAKAVQPLAGGAALLDIPAKDIPFARLGSVIKVGDVLTTLDTTDWRSIERFIVPAAKEHSAYVPDGKLTIGLSVYGLDVGTKMLERTSLEIKKAVKSTGRPVRIVPNKTHEISSAQILHNKLTHANGWELVFYREGKKTHVVRTDFAQDIGAYTARDQARPMRDARVGMLPPKLAQTIVNLATGQLQSRVSSNEPLDTSRHETILDPFCGTGVILQEALLMGYNVYGTDIEPRMVEYSEKNLEWLRSSQRVSESASQRVEGADATSHTWDFSHGSERKTLNFHIACEGYLGLPFAHVPSDKQLHESMQSSNTIMKGFLRNLAAQTASGFRACVALPAWHVKGKVIRLPVSNELEKLGWKRVHFTHARPQDLIYHREDQIVGRELVAITKV